MRKLSIDEFIGANPKTRKLMEMNKKGEKVFTKKEALKALKEWYDYCKKPFLKKDGTPKRVGRQATAEQVCGMLGAAWVLYIMGALTETEMQNYSANAFYYIDYWDDLRNIKEKNATAKIKIIEERGK